MKQFDPNIHKGVYIKASPEIKAALGVSPEVLQRQIDTGQIDGYNDGDKIIMINELKVPESFRPKNPNALPEPASPKDVTLAQAEVFKAEALKIEAEIRLTIAKGERDKPEVLMKREAELSVRESALTLREKEYADKKILLDATEQSLNLRDAKIISAEQGLQQEIINERAKAAREIKDQREHARLELVNLQIQQDELSKDIESKKSELTQLNESIESARKSILPIIENIDKWIKVTERHAQQSYFVANDKRYPKQTRDLHQTRSTNLWNNGESLKRIKKSLGGFLKGL